MVVHERGRFGEQVTTAGIHRYAVIGNPIAHSKSPQIHALFARSTGQAMSYERLLAPLDGFTQTLQRFAREAGRGANVTLPFKQQAFALAREHTERARAAAACNTLAWRGDHWLGDNTDGAGLLRDLVHNRGERVRGRRVLVLGAGGATRGILQPLLAERPRQVVIANRTLERAQALATLAAGFIDGAVVAPASLAELAGERFDLVINATSAGVAVGSTEDRAREPPWANIGFAPDALAYDLSYADQATPFLRWSAEHGATRTADGLGMLIEQAAESFLLWRGVRPDSTHAAALLRPDPRAPATAPQVAN